MSKLDMLEAPLDPHRLGREAYHEFYDAKDNPYPLASYAWERWRLGYMREHWKTLKESAA